MSEQACIYIMASKRNGTLYIGSATNLAKRAWEHRNGVVPGFTRERGCKLLVWYEVAGSWEAARQRELQMKKWNRAWKLREIEGSIPIGRTCTTASRCRERVTQGVRRRGGWASPTRTRQPRLNPSNRA